MLSRHEQDEQEELQAALLASLEDQYMPEHHKTHKEDDSNNIIGSDTYSIDSDASFDFDSDDMDVD